MRALLPALGAALAVLGVAAAAPTQAAYTQATAAQVAVAKATPAQVAAAQAGPRQATTAPATAAGAESTQASAAQATPTQATATQVAAAQATPAQAPPAEVAAAQATAAQVTSRQATPAQAGSTQTTTAHTTAAQVGSAQAAYTQATAAQVAAAQATPAQAPPAEVAAAQVGVSQDASTHVTSAQRVAAASGYRYWSFWESDGAEWSYATQGPATARPADGDVIGFRFSVSEDSQDSASPRHAADSFDAVCDATPAKEGAKRVAVVIDPGTPADAPAGDRPPAPRTACATAGADATAAEALASVAKPLRYDSSAMLCAISGYPKTGCGEQVSGREDPPRSAAPSTAAGTGTGTTEDDDGGSGPSAGLLVGLAAVFVLGAAGVWQARRRRG